MGQRRRAVERDCRSGRQLSCEGRNARARDHPWPPTVRGCAGADPIGPIRRRSTLTEGESKSGVDLTWPEERRFRDRGRSRGEPVAGAEVTAGPQEPDGRAFRRPGMNADGRAFSNRMEASSWKASAAASTPSGQSRRALAMLK